MGTTKKVVFAFFALLFLLQIEMSKAQDYLPERVVTSVDEDEPYTFKKNISLFAGSSFSIINFLRSSDAVTNYSISPPPLSFLLGYRPVHWFSIDAGFNYERYKMLYRIAGTNNYEKGQIQRTNFGIRPVIYAKVDEGNFILFGCRIGITNASGLKKLSAFSLFPPDARLFNSRSTSFQIFIGQQYKFAANSSLQYEFALGAPYYFSLGYVHHFNL